MNGQSQGEQSKYYHLTFNESWFKGTLHIDKKLKLEKFQKRIINKQISNFVHRAFSFVVAVEMDFDIVITFNDTDKTIACDISLFFNQATYSQHGLLSNTFSAVNWSLKQVFDIVDDIINNHFDEFSHNPTRDLVNDALEDQDDLDGPYPFDSPDDDWDGEDY